jgi:hypothetical protein
MSFFGIRLSSPAADRRRKTLYLPIALEGLDDILESQALLTCSPLEGFEVDSVLEKSLLDGGIDEVGNGVFRFGGLDPQRPMKLRLEIDGDALVRVLQSVSPRRYISVMTL